jgi:hypothetical protein
MIVKIKSCSYPSLWYKNKIGKTYEVSKAPHIVDQKAPCYFTKDMETIILKTDCDIIDDGKKKK